MLYFVVTLLYDVVVELIEREYIMEKLELLQERMIENFNRNRSVWASWVGKEYVMSVRTFGNQIWLDGIEFENTQVELGKRFKTEPFEEFIENFNMLWGFDTDKPEHVKELRLLYTYVTKEVE